MSTNISYIAYVTVLLQANGQAVLAPGYKLHSDTPVPSNLGFTSHLTWVRALETTLVTLHVILDSCSGRCVAINNGTLSSILPH